MSLEDQLVERGIPQSLWGILHQKYTKRNFQADLSMCFETKTGKIYSTQRLSRESSIFILNIMWTAKYDEIRPTLQTTPELVNRILPFVLTKNSNTEKKQIENKISDEQIDQIWKDLWKLYGTTTFITQQNGIEYLFFLLEEFGLRIGHRSDHPNFKLQVLVDPEDGTAFAVFWPILDIEKGDEITRDFFDGSDPKTKPLRSAILWNPESINEQSFIEGFNQFLLKVQAESEALKPVIEAIFSESNQPSSIPRAFDPTEKVTIYNENPVIKENLNNPNFIKVNVPTEAQIVWPMASIIQFKERNENQYVNQFPYEASLVNKGHLMRTIRKAFGPNVPWLPISYHLNEEFSIFLGDYFQRRKEGRDNLWILKPVALTRSLNISITDDLGCIVRHMEHGERVVSKYISNPALFHKKKFDMRYTVLLKSVEPLEIYVAREKYVRMANKEYSSDNFEEFEKHFTVMFYVRSGTTGPVKFQDFIKEFIAQHGSVDWNKIEDSIHYLIKSTFIAAVSQHTMHAPKARAIYGLDIMLDANFQPHLLEVTYCPDLRSLVKMQNSFVDDAFGCLFCNLTEGVIRI